MATNRLRPARWPDLRLSREDRAVLARSWPSLAAAVIAVVLILALAFDAGGYFPPAYLGAGLIAFLAVALLLVARPPHYRLRRPAVVALVALAGLAAWTALSASWSATPDTAAEDAQRDLVYLGLFGLGLIATGSGRSVRYYVWLILGAILVVVGAALLSRLYPDLIETSQQAARVTGYRLDYPLSYWNALGVMAAMGTVLALGLAADTRSPVVLRALAAGASVISATTMYLTFSRGAWMALAAGVAVLFVIGARRLSLLLSTAIVALASALSILRLEDFPALTDNLAAPPGQDAAGSDFAPFLLLLVVGAVVSQGVIAHMRASPVVMDSLRKAFRPLAVGLAVAILLVAAVAYGVAGSKAERRTAGAADDARGFVDRQWDDFMRAGSFSARGSARLTTARGTRSDVYRVAIDGFEAHPIRGDGSGTFENRWHRDREVTEKIRDAHSLYLETLGELGLVGVLILLTFIGSLAWAAVRSRLNPGGLGRSAGAAVTATCAVWVAHAAVDWDWQMPAVTGTALLLGATLYSYRGDRRGRRRRASSRPLWELSDPTRG